MCFDLLVSKKECSFKIVLNGQLKSL